MKIIILLIFIYPVLAMSTSAPGNIYKEGTLNEPALAVWLAKNNLPFTSVPFFKSLLATGRLSETAADGLQEVFATIGTSQFELFQENILKSSKSPYLRFIHAKKLFKKGSWEEAIKMASSIDEDHALFPFALSIQATAESFLGKNKESLSLFKQCQRESNQRYKSTSSPNLKRRYYVNREVCLTGIARVSFAARKFDETNSAYLDVQKSSPIWPEILFEEAWNSYYQKDFNRTLGKLVTYKAPVFTHVYNPEIAVLRALTYHSLCLYGDSQKEIEKFYSEQQPLANFLEGIIKGMGRNFKKYYFLAKNHLEDQKIQSAHGELGVILNDITRDPSFKELYDNFQKGKEELSAVKAVSDRRLRNDLLMALKESLVLQRDLVGAYVRRKLLMTHEQLKESLEGMSYIKLEMIGKRKAAIYNANSTTSEKRGEIANINITDKQYFWGFNGEFWADELGDYIFSLKSECQ